MNGMDTCNDKILAALLLLWFNCFLTLLLATWKYTSKCGVKQCLHGRLVGRRSQLESYKWLEPCVQGQIIVATHCSAEQTCATRGFGMGITSVFGRNYHLLHYKIGLFNPSPPHLSSWPRQKACRKKL
jgi:hypothetical protein